MLSPAHAPSAGPGRLPAAATRLGGFAALPVAAAGLGVVAVERPLLAVAVGIGLVFVWAAFSDLAAGVCGFTVLTFFERFPGLDTSSLTLVKLAGGLLAFAWVLAVLPRRGGVPLLLRDHPVLSYLLIAWSGWSFMSIAWAEDGGRAASSSFRTLQGVVLAFIVYSALREARHLRWLVLAFTSGAFLTAVVGLAGATEPESFGPGTTTRISGGIGDANELAAVLLPALAVAVFSLPAFRSALVRWLLLSFSVTYVIALFSTESRGGLVGLGAMLLAGAALAGPARPRALAVILAVAALGVTYYTLIAPPEAARRITEFTAGGGTGRTDLWRIAMRVAADHPLTGVGADNFSVVEPLYALGTIDLPRADLIVESAKVTHNMYLQVLADLGWVGLLLFLALVLGALRQALAGIGELARRGQIPMEVLARGVVIGTVGMFAAFTFLSAQHEKQLWLLLGVALAISSVARASREAAG